MYGPVKNLLLELPHSRRREKTPFLFDSISFFRKSSSEYDKEREELKDSVLAWKLRYQERQNKEQS